MESTVEMSQSNPIRRPVVGIFADCGYGYGRQILRGIAKYANLQRRWQLLVDTQRAIQTQPDWPELDAAIFAGYMDEDVERVRQRCRRIVVCSGSGDPERGAIVSVDDRAVGKLAAEHLINCRFTRFAFYDQKTETQFLAKEERLIGFQQTLAAHGFSCYDSKVAYVGQRHFVDRLHHQAVMEWLDGLPRPLGVFCFDDTWANDLAALCLSANIAVPEEIAIIGVNNDDVMCETSLPPLSSVDIGATRIGFVAAQQVERMLADDFPVGEERVTRLPPAGVVQRQSTDVLAVADTDVAAALRYIREHACDPCSVQDVLRAVPVGRRWLERQFAAHLGRTPRDEIIRVRIDVAKRLLAESDLNILELASRCGFANAKTFYQAFGQLAQTTPAKFRRLSRGANPLAGRDGKPARDGSGHREE